MAALDFPAPATIGDKYPVVPIDGVPQYVWDGEKWTTLGGQVGLDLVHVKRAGDTMTGLLELSGPPTLDLHASTKKYVDDGLAGRVSDAGDTMSGPLILPIAAPTLDTHAANKKYVDDRDAALIPAVATAAEYRVGTNAVKYLTPLQVWQASLPLPLTDGATVTPDFSLGFDFAWAIGAVGRTMANPTNVKIGQKGIIVLGQGIAGATITTWGTNWKFGGGVKPVLSTAINAQDILSYVAVSATFIACTFTADFK